MAPQWITKAGSLGIAVELEPFALDLLVQTGDARAQFAVISGQLPPGLRLSPQGNISGYPVGTLKGVPLAVNEETVFTFVVRCTNERGELADRTFSITVTGQDAPIPLIAPFPLNSLGTFNDGEWLEINLAAFDADPGDTLTYRLIGGTLPRGLTLDSNLGQITGYVEPGVFILTSLGFDTDNFDTVGFAQESSIDTEIYNFEIQIDDGKNPVIAAYSITVNKLNSHVPVLLNRSTDIGTVLDENYFFHKFTAKDFDDEEINYEILPIVRYPTIVGTAVNPVVTASGNLVINGETVTVTGNSVQSAAQDINAASEYLGNLTNITSEVQNGRLLIFSTGAANTTITVGNTTAAAELGIDANVYLRNVQDTNLDITQDLTEILPNNLQLNSETGWLYGFIDPLVVGEKTYDFFLRVFQPNSEPGMSSISVDYASEFPFSVVNNRTQDELDELGLDADNTDYVNKTIIFAQQQSFETSYTGLDGTVFTTGSSDGWVDPNGVLIPGYTTTPNKRGGVWRLVKNVNRTVVTGNSVGNSALVLNSANTLVTGMLVSGSNIAANCVISSIDAGNNTVSLTPAVTGTVSANAVINFSSSNYQLDFVRTVDTNTVVLTGRYTTTSNVGGYSQPGVKLFYETAATPPLTEPRYVIAAQNANSSLWPQRLTVTSSNNYQIKWITDSDLGTIISGTPSQLAVRAVNAASTQIEYQLSFVQAKTVLGDYDQNTVIRLRDVDGIVPGLRLRTADQNFTTSLPLIIAVDTNTLTVQLSQPVTLPNNARVELVGTDLPRGLQLTSNGDIQGRVSHQLWKLSDNTTFDSTSTTFDRTFIIPIRAVAYLNDPEPRQIVSVKTFKLTVNNFKDKPNVNLYLDFLLEHADRQVLADTVLNDQVVPDEHVYRLGDHWFGRQHGLKMLVAYGIDTADSAAVAAATEKYHHKKQYRFTDLRWAQSLNNQGQVEYEVIYLNPVDEYTLPTGAQLTGNVDVRNLGIQSTVTNQPIDYLFPASLTNMQQQLKTALTPNNRRYLPKWMTTRQPNQQILNFVPAVPLVYMKPGTGKTALYKLQQSLQVNQLHALTDRYYWDNGLADNFDIQLGKFFADPLTTFDQERLNLTQINVVATVDFAVEAPFYQINNTRVSDLKRLGLLDGYLGDVNGKTLIFFTQENYTALDDFENVDGWAQIVPQYDDQYDAGFETYSVVTGKYILDNLPAVSWTNFTAYTVGDLVQNDGVTYVCATTHNNTYDTFTRDFFVPVTSTTQYQQAGVWRIVEDPVGFVQLQFVQEIAYNNTIPYNSVRVTSGLKHGGSIVSLVPATTLGGGFTVPGYINQADIVSQTENGTIFDSSTTEFFHNRTDQYQEKDRGAKYIVFKQQTILDQGTVDV